MSGLRLLRASPALFYAVAVFYGGVMDIGPLPDTPGLPLDKLLHALAFLVLEWLVELALIEVETRVRRPIAVGVASAVGILLEGVQAALPHRSAELLDCVADVVGALLGAVLLALFTRRRPLRAES